MTIWRRRPAHRLLVTGLAAGIAVTVGCATASPSYAAPTPAAASENESSAVAYQLNALHDGRQIDPDFGGADQDVLWSKDLGGKVAYPLIVGESIFVDVANSGPNGATVYGSTVSAYDKRSGALLWGPVALGGTYNFSAIAYDRGRVFALNYDGKLHALDAATGEEIWSVQMPAQRSFTSPPTAIDGVVYLGGAGSGGTVFAIDEAAGDVLWTASVANGDHSSPAVDSTGVYVSYACEQTYSFTTAGVQRWRHSTSCSGGGGRTPVLHDGQVYVRDNSMTPAVLAESDGTQLSTFTSVPAPAFDDETMVGVSSGTLRSYDPATNEVRWSQAAPGDATYVTAPIIVNGYVVEGDSKGGVHLFDADSGADAWSGSAGTSIAAPDEQNAWGLTGLAEAQGVLAVPAGNTLTVFGKHKIWFEGGPENGATIGTSATFAFGTDLTDATFSCRLDDADAAPCPSPYTVSDLGNGPHTLTVQASSETAHTESIQTTFTTDAVAPAVNVVTVNQFSDKATTTRSWSASDTGSGVASYYVRYRTASAQSGFGSYQQPVGLHGTDATSATLHPAPGSTVCLSVRARDQIGNVSGWTADKCQTVLLDDRALSAAGSWYRPSGAAGFEGGTYSAASSRGAALTLANVHARRIEIVATTCSSCGRVAVSFPGMTSRTLNLYSSKTVKQAYFVLPQMTATSGKLTLTVLDPGKPVYIDAVSVWHN
jgi:outer membrane protein assembly factor BamB